MIAKTGRQQFIAQPFLRGMPVDIEEKSVAARWSVLQNVPPIASTPAADGHVVGYDVQNLSEMISAQLLAKAIVRVSTAQLVIYPMRINHIVAMFAAGRGLQIRRAVNVRNTEFLQIICNSGSIVKTKLGMELQPVSGYRYPGHLR
jgi:hypothetical protein